MSDDLEKDMSEINPLLMKLRQDPIAGDGKVGFLENRDGLKLFYRTWAKDIPKYEKLVFIMHGMGGHSEFFAILADNLISHDIMVIGHDYRGHGRSEGKRGDIKDFKNILEDAREIIEHFKKEHPNTPTFILGESMGGCVSINVTAQWPELIDGIILFAPAVKTNAGFSLKDVLTGLGGMILYPFKPNANIFSTQGREEEGIKNPIHQEYDRTDPLHLEKFSLRYVLRLNKYMKKALKEAVNEIEKPLLIFQGTDDKAISPEGAQEFFNNCVSTDKHLEMIENGYHSLMTDPDAQHLWKILVDWLKEH